MRRCVLVDSFRMSCFVGRSPQLSACARRQTGNALESAAEGRLGRIAQLLGHDFDRKPVLGKPLAGKAHPQFRGVS
ncbi:hypothetical protein G6F65_023250 [Rhizopus arrhizus]|nr:hypothetical protein G6F65_023250 [Rhizopus arrhizus]